MSSIRIGFAHRQAASLMVGPGGRVPVRPFPGIGRYSFTTCPERAQAGEMVGIVIRENGWLKGRTPFCNLSPPHVIGVTGGMPQSVRDNSRRVDRFPISVSSGIPRSIRYTDCPPGDVLDSRCHIATSIRGGENNACFRVAAGNTCRYSGIISTGHSHAIHDQGACRNFTTRYFVLADSLGISGILRPGNSFLPSRVNRNRPVFQCRGQGGNQDLFREGIGCSQAVVHSRGREPVDAVIPLFSCIGISRDAGIGGIGMIVQLPCFLRYIAKGVVFLQGWSHSGSRRSRIHLRLDKMPPFIIREPAVIETAQSIGRGRADDFPITVGDFPERCYRVSFSLRFQRDFPDAILKDVNPVGQFLLTRPSLVEKSTVRGSCPNQGCSTGKRRRRR